MSFTHNKTGGTYYKVATGAVVNPEGLVDHAPFVAYRTITEEGVFVCHRAHYEHQELNMIVHEGRMQTDNPLTKGDEVIIYIAKSDQTKWCRPTQEWAERFTNMEYPH